MDRLRRAEHTRRRGVAVCVLPPIAAWVIPTTRICALPFAVLSDTDNTIRQNTGIAAAVSHARAKFDEANILAARPYDVMPFADALDRYGRVHLVTVVIKRGNTHKVDVGILPTDVRKPSHQLVGLCGYPLLDLAHSVYALANTL